MIGITAALTVVLLTTVACGSTGIVTRVSVSPVNGEGDLGSHDLGLTPDQRYAIFFSDATNFVAGDTNSSPDIFIKDLTTGSINRVSTTSAGAQANGGSNSPSISSDARYVSFVSWATNLMTGDTNGVADIYKKDITTGAVSLVSTNTGGTVKANGPSSLSVITYDGRYVVFLSQATNLVTGDTNGVMDVFLRDTVTGTTTRISTNPAGGDANGTSGYDYGPWIAGEGRYVAFESDASNIVYGDSNASTDIFVKDTQTGVTTLASTTASGAQANDRSFFPSISKDGRYVLFRSQASNLAAGDTLVCGANNCSDIFLKDTLTGAVTWMSTDAAGIPADNASWDPHLSADGRYASFATNASNLVPGDTNSNYDIFVKDASTGAITLASANESGQSGDNWSIGPFAVDGGGLVAFESSASNLVPNDTNSAVDIFLSRVPICAETKPALTLTISGVRWNSYADYLARQLTVDFNFTNAAGPDAFNVSIVGEQTTNGVTAITAMPNNIGGVAVGANLPFSLLYSVPSGTTYFKTLVYATAEDACGLPYTYPSPYPGA